MKDAKWIVISATVSVVLMFVATLIVSTDDFEHFPITKRPSVVDTVEVTVWGDCDSIAHPYNRFLVASRDTLRVYKTNHYTFEYMYFDWYDLDYSPKPRYSLDSTTCDTVCYEIKECNK